MANFLTDKIGPLPGWAWGGLAAGGAFVAFTLLGNKSSSTSSTSTGSLTNNPAASSIPYVPSVTVDETSGSTSTTTGATGGTWTVTNPAGTTLFTSAPASSKVNGIIPAGTPLANAGQLPSGTMVQANGAMVEIPWGNENLAMVPITYNGSSYLVNSANMTQGTSGSGSYETLGLSPWMGWTSGAAAVGGGPTFIRQGKGGKGGKGGCGCGC